ncbi:hypothetical protein [Dactylosporangium sp. NPDC000521]|uniref:hypothetical protein n=1 Tax=Dactylosporangium sp. NPDC000521 TaxID=3363975 RepID=UPI0036BC6753
MSRFSDDALVRALVRQAEALLDEFLPQQFTLEQLHACVEERRGRRIEVRSWPMPAGGPHGLWVVGDMTDYVYVDGNAPALRYRQILGHEYGHVLFDDQGGPLPDFAPQLAGDRGAGQRDRVAHVAGARTTPLPTGPWPADTRGCTRTGYDEIVEQRCEWFGTVVLQRLSD